MANSPDTSALLRPEDETFIQQGISICVASRDVRHVPSISRALACRVNEDGRLTLILSRSQSAQLIRDLERFAQIAVVFTQPSTHRSLQIKGSDARVASAGPSDRDLVVKTEQAFVAELAKIGFPAESVRPMFACAEEDLCVVTFTPADIFTQTPGPGAGARQETTA